MHYNESNGVSPWHRASPPWKPWHYLHPTGLVEMWFILVTWRRFMPSERRLFPGMAGWLMVYLQQWHQGCQDSSSVFDVKHTKRPKVILICSEKRNQKWGVVQCGHNFGMIIFHDGKSRRKLQGHIRFTGLSGETVWPQRHHGFSILAGERQQDSTSDRQHIEKVQTRTSNPQGIVKGECFSSAQITKQDRFFMSWVKLSLDRKF